MNQALEIEKWRGFFKQNLPEGTAVKLFFQRMEFTIMLPDMEDLFDLCHPETEQSRERRTSEFRVGLGKAMQVAGGSVSFGCVEKIIYMGFKPTCPVSMALQEVATIQREADVRPRGF